MSLHLSYVVYFALHPLIFHQRDKFIPSEDQIDVTINATISIVDDQLLESYDIKQSLGERKILSSSKLKNEMSLEEIVDPTSKLCSLMKSGLEVKFKQYSPNSFQQIQRIFSVNPQNLWEEWVDNEGSLKKGAGKSGSLFLFSKTKRFILKTLPKTEKTCLKTILTRYSNFITSNFPETFLLPILGLFSFQDTHFVIILNLFKSSPTLNNLQFSTVFDLKGSKKSRKASEVERSKEVPVLLDLDLNQKFSLPETSRNSIISQLERDSAFLASENLMDYSFLVGISEVSEDNQQHFREGLIPLSDEGTTHLYGSQTQEKRLFYVFGIIDFLSPYNAQKIVAHFLKEFFWRSEDLSTVDSLFYSSRFIKFLSGCFESTSSEKNSQLTSND